MSDKKRWREETLNPSLNKNEKLHNEIDSDFVNSEEDLKDKKKPGPRVNRKEEDLKD